MLFPPRKTLWRFELADSLELAEPALLESLEMAEAVAAIDPLDVAVFQRTDCHAEI